MARQTDPLSKLATPEEIRALLGVSDEELKDSQLDLPVFLRGVKASVNRIDPRIWSTYAALPESPLTDTDEEQFADAFQSYATMRAAQLLAISLPNYGVRSLTDGKAAFTRQTDSVTPTLENLRLEVDQAASELADAAGRLLPVIPAARVSMGLIGRATLGANDPVTGQ